MTFPMILRTLFEILLVVGVIWGFLNEERLAAAEKRFFSEIKSLIRRRRLRIAKNTSTERKILKMNISENEQTLRVGAQGRPYMVRYR